MELIQILKDIAYKICEIEKEASVALYERGDKETYAAKLHLKAEVLAQLPQQCAKSMKGLSSEMQSFVQDGVGGFSFSAEKALQLNSIFYMSALLYPTEYKEGDQNDLETFIDKLESWVQ